MNIPEGYEVLPGRGKENARAALDKAVENGFAAEDVRTVRDGYLIPTKEKPESEAASETDEKPPAEENSEATEKKSTRRRGASKKE